MSFKLIRKLPGLDELSARYPLSQQARDMIAIHRCEVQDILSGKDNRLIIIIGPCSAWPSNAVLDFAQRLKAINNQLKSQLKLVLRVYIQKPRTKLGWLGPITQPDPLLEANISKGLWYARDLMVNIAEMGLPIADEALFNPVNRYFAELLSWVAVGARSSENQEHRIRASAMDCPVGIKNPTSGSIRIGVNGVAVAQQPHQIIYGDYEALSSGNPYAHLVLRGGNGKSNISLQHLQKAHDYLISNKIVNPAIIVDASHENNIINGIKDPLDQPYNAFNVLEEIKHHPHLIKLLKGFMFESFIKYGNQSITNNMDMGGLSITDACLSWEQTKTMLFDLAAWHESNSRI